MSSEGGPGPCAGYPAPTKAPEKKIYPGAASVSGAGGFVMPGRTWETRKQGMETRRNNFCPSYVAYHHTLP